MKSYPMPLSVAVEYVIADNLETPDTPYTKALEWGLELSPDDPGIAAMGPVSVEAYVLVLANPEEARAIARKLMED